MIEDIKAGCIKNVLVFKLDRLTRSVADLIFLIDIFNQNGCAFNSLMESLDTSTASGRMFIKIIGIFAEFERENIAERVRVGKERKAREGYANNSSNKSYGFDREKGELIQTINEEEAQNVRMIFDMYVNQGMSLSAIAKSFNMQKITSKKGSLWNAASIKGVLTNCNAMGNVRYCMNEPDRKFEAEGKHEAIITEELYNAAQILIKKNARTAPTKKPVQQNYFVNLLYCNECGEKLYTHNTVYSTKKNGKTKLFSFQCRKRSLKGGCNSKNISAGKVENALIEYFMYYDEMFMSDRAEAARVEDEKQNNDNQIQCYRDRLKHFDNKAHEINSHYLNGNIEFDDYSSLTKQLESERTFLREEIEKLTDSQDSINSLANFYEEITASFLECWQGLTNGEKRLFLTNFIKKIIVSNEPQKESRFGITKIMGIEFVNSKIL